MGVEKVIVLRDPRLPIAKRIDDLLQRLTPDERIAFLHQFAPAVDRLGVAAFRTGQEALHGVAWMGPATVFPQAVGLGATWATVMDVALTYAVRVGLHVAVAINNPDVELFFDEDYVRTSLIETVNRAVELEQEDE